MNLSINKSYTFLNFYRWKELRSIQALNQTPLKLKEVVPSLAKIGELMYDFINTQKSQTAAVMSFNIIDENKINFLEGLINFLTKKRIF